MDYENINYQFGIYKWLKTTLSLSEYITEIAIHRIVIFCVLFTFVLLKSMLRSRLALFALINQSFAILRSIVLSAQKRSQVKKNQTKRKKLPFSHTAYKIINNFTSISRLLMLFL